MAPGGARSCAVMLLCLLMSALARVADSAPRASTGCNTAAGGGCHTPGEGGRGSGKVRAAAGRARRQTVVVEVPKDASHRVACTRAEVRRAACLKGECYALDIPGMRSVHCHCPQQYEGSRCEKLSVYYFLNFRADMEKFIIIIVVVIPLIVLIVVISTCYSYKKCCFRSCGQKKQRKEGAPDSEAMLPKDTQPSPDQNGSLEVKAESNV